MFIIPRPLPFLFPYIPPLPSQPDVDRQRKCSALSTAQDSKYRLIIAIGFNHNDIVTDISFETIEC